MNTKHVNNIDAWQKVATALKSRLDTDYRNHLRLRDPWGRAAHCMVQGWRNIASQGRLGHIPHPRRRIFTWKESAQSMKVSLDSRARDQRERQTWRFWANHLPPVGLRYIPKASRPFGPVTTGNVLRLLEGQQYRCALTGRQLTPNTASLDHIVPVRCGGEHLVENTQVLHKDVNRAKTTMTNEEFIQLCREVVEYTNQIKIEGEMT